MAANTHCRRSLPPGSSSTRRPSVTQFESRLHEDKVYGVSYAGGLMAPPSGIRMLLKFRVGTLLRMVFSMAIITSACFSVYTLSISRSVAPVEEVPQWVHSLEDKMKTMEMELHTLRGEKQANTAVVDERLGVTPEAGYEGGEERAADAGDAPPLQDYDLLLGPHKTSQHRDASERAGQRSQVQQQQQAAQHMHEAGTQKAYFVHRAERMKSRQERFDVGWREEQRARFRQAREDELRLKRVSRKEEHTGASNHINNHNNINNHINTTIKQWEAPEMDMFDPLANRNSIDALAGEDESVEDRASARGERGPPAGDELATEFVEERLPDWDPATAMLSGLVWERKDPSADLTKQRKIVSKFNVTNSGCAWRQTDKCSPSGLREADMDRDCLFDVGPESSGFCQCEDGVLVAPSACNHNSFICGYKCLGCGVFRPVRITHTEDNCTSLGMLPVPLTDAATTSGASVPLEPPAQTSMQMKIYESMLKGASSDLEDACALGRDAVLSPPTMSEHDMRQLRLFFAVDLHNNQATMGTFTKELIKVLSMLLPENVFVSVYESGSSDDTSAWTSILGGMLKMMEVPHVVITNSTDAKDEGQNRIQFLASVRNRAMQPITQFDAHPDKWFDHVVFLNDVMFCAQDIRRLLTHRADLACGLDFDNIGGRVGFYDTWVARDVEGRPFTKHPMFAPDVATATSLKKGLPAAVYCCWNGLAVLNAEPFHRGLRFRRNKLGECAASECSLMCKDLSYNGYTRKVVDPMVRLAYNVREFRTVREQAPGSRKDAGNFLATRSSAHHATLPMVPQGVNLALNINARVRSSNKDGSAENEMAIDGDADTFWIGDQNDHAWWLEVDLGNVHAVRSMKLIWQIGCAANYSLSSSVDGKVWEELFSKSFLQACNGRPAIGFRYGSCTKATSGWQACGSVVEARYFRLSAFRQTSMHQPMTWSPSVYEWEMHDRANLRATKTATQPIKYPSKPPYGVRCCPLDGTGRDPNLNKCHDESPPHDWPQFATRLPKLILTKHAALRNRSIGNALSKAKGPERVAAASEEVADGPDTRNAATEAVTGKQGAGAGWRHEAAIMPLQANTVLAVTVDNEEAHENPKILPGERPDQDVHKASIIPLDTLAANSTNNNAALV